MSYKYFRRLLANGFLSEATRSCSHSYFSFVFNSNIKSCVTLNVQPMSFDPFLRSFHWCRCRNVIYIFPFILDACMFLRSSVLVFCFVENFLFTRFRITLLELSSPRAIFQLHSLMVKPEKRYILCWDAIYCVWFHSHVPVICSLWFRSRHRLLLGIINEINMGQCLLSFTGTLPAVSWTGSRQHYSSFYEWIARL